MEFSFGIETADIDISLILDIDLYLVSLSQEFHLQDLQLLNEGRLSENRQPISNSLLFHALIPASSLLHSNSQKPDLISNQTGASQRNSWHLCGKIWFIMGGAESEIILPLFPS